MKKREEARKFLAGEIRNLQELERTLVAQISSLDVARFAKRRENLSKEAEGLRNETRTLLIEMQQPPQIGIVDVRPLVWLRYLALGWNLLLSMLLARHRDLRYI